MLLFPSLAILLVLAVFLYMRQPKFGKKPSNERLAALKKSPQFSNGKFQNISHTPTLTKGYSMRGIIYEQLFKPHPNKTPKNGIPSVQTDLHQLEPSEPVLVWFGHSSYYMQLEGKRFLIDPVFSGNASPVPGSVKAFKGSNGYAVDDLPEIDYLLISHDHYDHLDYETIIGLKNKVGTIICGLGVGSHFEYWGFNPQTIIEKDWNETFQLNDSITISTTSARHFSGRGFIRNNTLWLSYVIETPSQKIFVGGDSGYDSHFSEIGEKHGPFDLAILENGQYNLAWEAIHMLPEQVLKAALDLNAKKLFPVHSGKFALAMHPWNEPLNKVTEYNATHKIPLVTPMIGEKVLLGDDTQTFKVWWNDIN